MGTLTSSKLKQIVDSSQHNRTQYKPHTLLFFKIIFTKEKRKMPNKLIKIKYKNEKRVKRSAIDNYQSNSNAKSSTLVINCGCKFFPHFQMEVILGSSATFALRSSRRNPTVFSSEVSFFFFKFSSIFVF